MKENNHTNIATFIHLSTFSRFIIPFGNFLGPLVLWIINKEKSEFIDEHGKQAINFQISILIYSLIIGLITIPFFAFSLLSGLDFMDFNLFNGIHFNISKPTPLFYIGGSLGFLAVIAFILEIVFIIKASIKARDGDSYEYPFSIKFLK
ncbi:hypothetical protein CLV86_1594 [Lacinutrix venerupis]|uniref:Tic20 family protein n=1 Tax=Lacinutrix venerupis TaxID=1486034 RepID=A0AAC9LNT9_9FLAO|nr:DUF4870 domain-containing protein [Lacinutrix venerupis]APY00822.1 hypothetical protein BWR22_11030 [Lacinutrix venerupis]RLJ64474.1 hypothetical protein CLV86_1594 [Lacinutrix venerupis]